MSNRRGTDPWPSPQIKMSFRMSKQSWLAVLVLFTTSVPAFAQHNYSIPIDSWTYNVIQQLQTRGYLLNLSPGFKPYRRLEVAQALQRFEQETDVLKFPQADRWLIKKLQNEFSYELRLLQAEKANPDTSLIGARFSEEDFINFAKGDYSTFKYADKLEFRPTIRTEFGFDIGNNLSLYTDATIDQTLRDDTLYTGSTKFGLDALHQQAYIQYSNRYLDFTFGRDYLSWGHGNDGSVLVSPTAGAFDMASLFIKMHAVKFNWFVAQLNPMHEFTPDTNSYMPFPTIGVPDPMANRYFTGSRFEFNIANKVFLGAYQAAIFGGPYASVNFENINPVRLNYETAANDHLENSNNFLGGDISIFWPRNLNFYADLTIDDWQVDHKTIGDLKPNLYAIQAGVRWSNLFESFGVSGTDVSLQYMMAGNRVYNEYNWSSYQKLLLRNYPIASPYGDDFWSIDFRLSQWVTYDWKFALEMMHLEHGSSNIYSFYTMPWLTDPSITLQTGYHEPFPYGVIEETNLLRVDAMYQPQTYLYGSLSVIYAHNRNADYIPGVNKSQFSFLLTIYYDFSYSLLFR